MKVSNVLVAVLFLSFLVGCNVLNEKEVYVGDDLEIGVIGKIPEVRENNIAFSTVTFSDLEKKSVLQKLDAIFIMEEFLPEASLEKNVKKYKETEIPYFFIGTKKSYVPFTNEDIGYDEIPDIEIEYAAGFYSSDKSRMWGFSLNNYEETESNIKDIYTEIFEVIVNDI
ncbi:hypothetical protein SAMN04487944_11524 [Gracilibacillus ureilyticus]|uniref:Lipoprotein n=1 Tax=Gracilibacillus ureilyticus TaxID=531814 RepID=A0A1H9TX33_9BACI|nr:hypothetical protein [Gracilibacillus ureilyticus]SES01467.1 hypothetical protein SAMN04487944_11524 [Gracilibacillus ureilyticus]